MEHLTPLERVERILAAGADQLGGEACPELVVQLVGEGRVTRPASTSPSEGCWRRSSCSASSTRPGTSTRTPPRPSSGPPTSWPQGAGRSPVPSRCSPWTPSRCPCAPGRPARSTCTRRRWPRTATRPSCAAGDPSRGPRRAPVRRRPGHRRRRPRPPRGALRTPGSGVRVVLPRRVPGVPGRRPRRRAGPGRPGPDGRRRPPRPAGRADAAGRGRRHPGRGLRCVHRRPARRPDRRRPGGGTAAVRPAAVDGRRRRSPSDAPFSTQDPLFRCGHGCRCRSSGQGRALARATPPYQCALGLGVRSNVSRSHATRPNVGRYPEAHS